MQANAAAARVGGLRMRCSRGKYCSRTGVLQQDEDLSRSQSCSRAEWAAGQSVILLCSGRLAGLKATTYQVEKRSFNSEAAEAAEAAEARIALPLAGRWSWTRSDTALLDTWRKLVARRLLVTLQTASAQPRLLLGPGQDQSSDVETSSSETSLTGPQVQ